MIAPGVALMEAVVGKQRPVLRRLQDFGQAHRGRDRADAHGRPPDEPRRLGRQHADERVRVQALLEPTGATLWVDRESDLDAVTALSGSGPAYVFYFLEALLQAAQEMGLDAAQGRALALATCAGATELARRSDEPLAVLRERVTSKGGTTFAALSSMEADGVKAARIHTLFDGRDVGETSALEYVDPFEAFLKQFPNGTFAPLASARLEQLKAKPVEVAAAASEPAPEPTPAPAPAETQSAAVAPEPAPLAIEAMSGVYVAKKSANLRAAPDTKSAVLGKLAADQPVDVTGKVAGGDWLRVAFKGKASLSSAVAFDMYDERIRANTAAMTVSVQ